MKLDPLVDFLVDRQPPVDRQNEQEGRDEGGERDALGPGHRR
jgi:hypothetical protein